MHRAGRTRLVSRILKVVVVAPLLRGSRRHNARGRRAQAIRFFRRVNAICRYSAIFRVLFSARCEGVCWRWCVLDFPSAFRFYLSPGSGATASGVSIGVKFRFCCYSAIFCALFLTRCDGVSLHCCDSDFRYVSSCAPRPGWGRRHAEFRWREIAICLYSVIFRVLFSARCEGVCWRWCVLDLLSRSRPNARSLRRRTGRKRACQAPGYLQSQRPVERLVRSCERPLSAGT